MGRYWRLMGEYDAEAATFSNFAGGGGASPYTPQTDGRLVAVRVVNAATAATSLVEAVLVRLTCSAWTPNMLEVGVTDTGLRTAPAFAHAPMDWLVDQPVKAGVPITLEGRHLAGTPVTCQTFVFGLFES